jgi:Tfp pilus assembly protein PilF
MAAPAEPEACPMREHPSDPAAQGPPIRPASRVTRRGDVGRAALLAALATAACATYQPYDTLSHTREQAREQVGGDLAADVELPFELNDEILAYVTGRVAPSANDKKRVDQVLDLIFSGVGLEYSLQPTRDAVGTFYARQANCLSFTHLFVGIGRSQHLNPFYVEVEDYQRWSYQDGTVVSRGHIVAGMVVDGNLATFDFLPYRPKTYRDFKTIDDLEAMAHHYNNLGAEALIEHRLDEAESNLRIANRLDPDFDKAVNNLGVLYLRRGRPEEAIAVYEEALTANPEFIPILSNLSSAYRRVGRTEDADRTAARLESLDYSNPFYFIYRGTEALEGGDDDTALDYMRRALSIDTEIPETHIGLAKVYMARGELKKAHHHIGRALQLDATNVEARRFAALMDQQVATPAVAPDGP